MNFIKKFIKLLLVRNSKRLSKKKLDRIICDSIDKNEKILEQLGDELDYDGMGDWGRFPPIKKKTPK